MNLADVFTYLFVILGFIIVYNGYWLMAAGLFPAFTERCAAQIGGAPVKTTLLGAVTLPPLVALGLTISGQAPSAPVKVLGVGLALVALLGGLFGAAGLALRVGQGLPSQRDLQEPWRRVLRGGIVLSLTFVLPFVGTFLLMPFAFLSGFGAFLLARKSRPLHSANAFTAGPAVPPMSPQHSVTPAFSAPSAAAEPARL